MAKKNEQDVKKCWVCKSILVDDGKLGLCPKCINKYGSPAAALGLLDLGIVGKQLVKNGGKIAEVSANVVKRL
ncbi:hypothetical protein AGMMS49975_06320 [Clostridia bacterium]|nr:hypothetical protein AGMMS49975_06320 [Clostridia bacterium]